MIILMWFDKHKNRCLRNLTLFCSHSDDATGGWFRVLSKEKSLNSAHITHGHDPICVDQVFQASSSSTAVNGQQQQLDIVRWDTHKVERIREWNVERVWYSLIFFVCKLSHQFTSEFYIDIILQSEKMKAELRWTWERSNRSTDFAGRERRRRRRSTLTTLENIKKWILEFIKIMQIAIYSINDYLSVRFDSVLCFFSVCLLS